MHREKNHETSITRISLLALVLVLLPAATLVAQAPEVTPHSVFLQPKQDIEPGQDEEIIDCYPAMCKFYDGNFDSTRVWTHTTNNSNRDGWIEVCLSNSDGDFVYEHDPLPAGGTHWSYLKIPKGHWGWIQEWVIIPADPDKPDDPNNEIPKNINSQGISPLTISTNTSGLFEHPEKGLIRVNEAVATMQFGRLPAGRPIATSLNYQPGPDTPGWSVLARHNNTADASSTFEQWKSTEDPRLNLNYDTQVKRTTNGRVLVNKQDFDNDGITDRVTTMEIERTEHGKNLYLVVREGDEVRFARDLFKVDRGNKTFIDIDIDKNGDGTIDARESQSIRKKGKSRFSKIERDFDADGTMDELETIHLEYRGLNDTTQITHILTPAGVLKEKIRVELSPQPEGFQIVTFHDEDGDGTFDVREVQNSKLGPFASGTDVETLRIDEGNDGSFESSHTTVTRKSFDGSIYREDVTSDVWSDGTVDAATYRLKLFNTPISSEAEEPLE